MLPGFSIVGVSRGYSLVTVHRFSIAVASLVAEMGSRCMGFSHYGLWAQLPLSMWNLPGPEIEPMNAVVAAAAAAKSLQSCPTLCNPMDGSPPGSPVPGTLQARTLEWVAISFSDA